MWLILNDGVDFIIRCVTETGGPDGWKCVSYEVKICKKFWDGKREYRPEVCITAVWGESDIAQIARALTLLRDPRHHEELLEEIKSIKLEVQDIHKALEELYSKVVE